MKKIFFIATCLVISLMVAAQEEMRRPRRTPEQMAEKQTELMQRDLGLSQEQRDTVSQILLKYAMMYKEDEDRDVRMIRMEYMQKELQQVLSVEQFERYMQKVRDRGPKKQMVQRVIPLDTAAPAIHAEYELEKEAD